MPVDGLMLVFQYGIYDLDVHICILSNRNRYSIGILALLSTKCNERCASISVGQQNLIHGYELMQCFGKLTLGNGKFFPFPNVKFHTAHPRNALSIRRSGTSHISATET
jgi:hypothetical protein